jgi:hypothetical protein
MLTTWLFRLQIKHPGAEDGGPDPQCFTIHPISNRSPRRVSSSSMCGISPAKTYPPDFSEAYSARSRRVSSCRTSNSSDKGSRVYRCSSNAVAVIAEGLLPSLKAECGELESQWFPIVALSKRTRHACPDHTPLNLTNVKVESGICFHHKKDNRCPVDP